MLFFIQKIFGALLTSDFSKTFDCLSHDLIITKLIAYGFSFEADRLVPDYLINCKQRTKFSSYLKNIIVWLKRVV